MEEKRRISSGRLSVCAQTCCLKRSRATSWESGELNCVCAVGCSWSFELVQSIGGVSVLGCVLKMWWINSDFL